MSTKEGNIGRRAQAMTGIPPTVAIPKFLSPKEIESVKELKQDRPELSWDQAVQEVVLSSVKKKK